MSKISQELKVLLYLNQRYARTKWVTIREIADYLEVSDRQARRYLEDLDSITDITIETKLGRDGGYRLKTPLDRGFAMPENVVLAMSIAMKRNERIEKVLSELPNYVITDSVAGDNVLDNELLDKLEIAIKAIQNQKQLSFFYRNIPTRYLVDPYKIIFTNHTYYLFTAHDGITKKFDISLMRDDLQQLGSFKPDPNVLEDLKYASTHYGIGTRAEGEGLLIVKCKNEQVLLKFDKYFEGKGTMNRDELTYIVFGNSEHELYYPLFRISTKDYEFIDEGFKTRYIDYLEKQIRSIKNGWFKKL